MSFTVFLTYGNDPEEQVIAWRLQTLAAANGIQVLVPARGIDARGGKRPVSPSAELRRMLDQADCVLAIVTTGLGSAAEAEIRYALAKRKLVIPLVREGVTFPASLGPLQTFSFTPWNAGEVESRVAAFLGQHKLNQQKQQTIGGLIAIGLGLFLLAALAKK